MPPVGSAALLLTFSGVRLNPWVVVQFEARSSESFRLPIRHAN